VLWLKTVASNGDRPMRSCPGTVMLCGLSGQIFAAVSSPERAGSDSHACFGLPF